MNKVIKYCLTSAGVFIVLGVVICGVCFLLGGKNVFAEAIDYANENTVLTIERGAFGIFDTSIDFDKKIGSGNKISEKLDGVYSVKADEVSELVVKFGAGQLIINESEDENIHVSADNEADVKCGLKGNKLIVETSRAKGIAKVANGNNVIIAIPSNAKFDKVNLEIGACECIVNTALEINNDLDVSIGAGSLVLTKVKANSMDVDLGAGSVEIYSLNVDNADFEVGMGSIEAKGDINKKLDAECAMGSIDLVLDRPVSEYNFDIDCSMGSVEIDGKEYAGIASSKNQKGSSDTLLDLECSMGAIVVDFSK